jgi:hypothetical protein
VQCSGEPIWFELRPVNWGGQHIYCSTLILVKKNKVALGDVRKVTANQITTQEAFKPFTFLLIFHLGSCRICRVS